MTHRVAASEQQHPDAGQMNAGLENRCFYQTAPLTAAFSPEYGREGDGYRRDDPRHHYGLLTFTALRDIHTDSYQVSLGAGDVKSR